MDIQVAMEPIIGSANIFLADAARLPAHAAGSLGPHVATVQGIANGTSGLAPAAARAAVDAAMVEYGKAKKADDDALAKLDADLDIKLASVSGYANAVKAKKAGWLKLGTAKAATSLAAAEAWAKKVEALEKQIVAMVPRLAYVKKRADKTDEAKKKLIPLYKKQFENAYNELNNRHDVENPLAVVPGIITRLKEVENVLSERMIWTDHLSRASTHKGAGLRPEDEVKPVIEKFLAAGLLRRGRLMRKYPGHNASEFGVEWTIAGSLRIVLHAHVRSVDGKPTPTANAVHWKILGDKTKGYAAAGHQTTYPIPATYHLELMKPDLNLSAPFGENLKLGEEEA